MTQLKCPTCNQKFDPANRAQASAPAGSVAQIVYCSDVCKKKMNNKRYYARNADRVISRVIANRK